MKKLVSLLLAGLTLFSLAACSGGGSGGGGTAAPQNSGTGEGGAVRTLTVANWQATAPMRSTPSRPLRRPTTARWSISISIPKRPC